MLGIVIKYHTTSVLNLVELVLFVMTKFVVLLKTKLIFYLTEFNLFILYLWNILLHHVQ